MNCLFPAFELIGLTNGNTEVVDNPTLRELEIAPKKTPPNSFSLFGGDLKRFRFYFIETLLKAMLLDCRFSGFLSSLYQLRQMWRNFHKGQGINHIY